LRTWIHLLIGLTFLLSACHRGNGPSARRSREAALGEACSVGELLEYEDYQKWEEAVRKARKERSGVSQALAKINDGTEPEATFDLLQVLTDPKTHTFLGNFNAAGTVGLDGLSGLRVIRQLECATEEGKRLLSFIAPYHWNSAERRFLPTVGADSFRIRIQLDEFSPGERGEHSEGVAAFSWLSEAGSTGSIAHMRGESYLADNGSFRISVDSRAIQGECTGCHHSTHLNTFSERYRTQPLAQMRGYRQFMKVMQANPAVSAEELEQIRVALEGVAAWDTSDLKQALRNRWENIGERALKDHGVTEAFPIP
jgi:hypothetical protein